MANERLTADDRTAQLAHVAYEIAKSNGIRKVTRAEVARRTEVSDGLINRYFDGREGLRLAALERAVELRDAKTLAAAAAEHYELPSMPRTLAAEVKRMH